MYGVKYTAQARRDYKKLKESHLHEVFLDLLEVVRENPYQTPPPFEYLSGEMSGALSRRLSRQHRLVYQVDKHEKIVKVIRMWTHYE